MSRRCRPAPGRCACAALLFALAACATRSPDSRSATNPPVEPAVTPVTLDAPPALVVEIVVTGKDGKPVDAMRPADFEVAVDGRRRLGLSIARLYRGPGAAFMAAQRPAAIQGELQPLSEPSRTVIVAIDQSSLLPGEEQGAREAAETCIGLLGLSDRIGVVALPAGARAEAVSFERAAATETLQRLRAKPVQAAARLAGESEDEGGATRDAAAGRGGATHVEAAREEPSGAGASREAGDPAPSESLRAVDASGKRNTGEAATAALTAHAVSTLDALRQLLGSMEPAPGGKTILFLSGGLVASGAEAELRATVEAAARAHVRLVSLRLPTTSPLRNAGVSDLQRLAEQTGGSLVSLTRRPQQLLARVTEQLSVSYLLLLAPAPGDADPKPHAVRVRTPRREDLVVQAPALVARGRLQIDALSAALSPAARAAVARVEGGPPIRRTVPSASQAPLFSHDHDVDLVLARVSQYVNDYGPVLSSIVSEERYVQEIREGFDKSTPTRKTTLLSDFLTVKIEGSDGWLPFRDVFEVNGKAVRDRQDRLSRLFMDRPSPERLQERGNAIIGESARYNIGKIVRTLNIPTLALWFLEPDSTRRFAFRKTGEETLDGRKLWVLQYSEMLSPTFVKTPEGHDLPSWGSLWVDPLNGTVHKTELRVSAAVVTVTYGRWPGLPGVWLPLEMKERYALNGQVVTGEATYTKFRQFRVMTEQEIQLPKK